MPRAGRRRRSTRDATTAGGTRTLALKMCDKSASAIRIAKEAIDNGLEMDFTRAERYEADLFALCFTTEDCKEGISAFMEKRAAKF